MTHTTIQLHIFETDTLYTAIYATNKEEAIHIALGLFLARKVKANPFMSACEYGFISAKRHEELKGAYYHTQNI